MVPRITVLLMRFTPDWAAQLHPDALTAACREAGDTTWRDRLLPPVTTRHLCLGQIRPGHTACSHVPHLSGLRFSASASAQARTILPRDPSGLLLTRLCSSVPPRTSDEERWHGPRTVFVAGSAGSMPDTPA